MRHLLAGLDTATGEATAWDPNPMGSVTGGSGASVFALAASDQAVYIGGNFTSIGGQSQWCLAAFTTNTVGVPQFMDPTRTILVGRNSPNPFRDATLIQLSLTTAERVTIGVFDLAGREVARLLENAPCAAGTHQVEFRAHGLPSGAYLCRIRAGAAATTRRLALIR